MLIWIIIIAAIILIILGVVIALVLVPKLFGIFKKKLEKEKPEEMQKLKKKVRFDI